MDWEGGGGGGGGAGGISKVMEKMCFPTEEGKLYGLSWQDRAY